MDKEGRRGMEAGDLDEGFIESRGKILAAIDLTRTQAALDLAKKMAADIQAGSITGEKSVTWGEIVGQLQIINKNQFVNLNPTGVNVLRSPLSPNHHLASMKMLEEASFQTEEWALLADSNSKLRQRHVLPQVNLWWQTVKAKDRKGDTPIEGLLLGWVGWLRNKQRKNEELLTVTGDTKILWDDITQLALRAVGQSFKSYPAWEIAVVRAIMPPDLAENK